MTTFTTPSQQIVDVVTTWEGVTTHWGDRGELSFRVGRREIGHLHGDHAAHFLFSRALASELRAAGRVGPHPIFPEHPKLAARPIRNAIDVADVIELLRLNHEQLLARAAA
ncbi:luciferase family protein [Paraconexibacter algicola]|uniref:Luciferase domain-containing protein n=1 Tax=Paraconexibacter algicola TaxID=2133960 RepID=A0A2T4UJ97_9ACTN|nr:luciferase family protein [Paraconexibacter algicola]PTL59314.1 hypothetical protein C7Y72_06440 [Paraconexibacter algicola]